MTYLERIDELQYEIRYGMNHSDEIELSVIVEWNKIIEDVMYGDKHWDDEYK